jgi:hypothetical protein
MSEQQSSITNKLEELFLSILRNVILFVLAGSVLASVFLAISGVSDLGAKPKDYKYEKFDSKQLMIDLKESLQIQSEAKPEAKPDPAKKPSPQASNPFEDELTKQANFVVEFYKKYEFGVNASWLNEQFKPRLRKQARNFSMVYGEGDAALLEYAKGQTQVIELVLMNPELNQLLDKKFKSQGEVDGDEKYPMIHEFANKVLGFYPDFHETQINQKKAFETEQSIEVGMRNSGAMMKLYIAGGVFIAFLFISLILVLVKIERNLRTTKIEVLPEA